MSDKDSKSAVKGDTSPDIGEREYLVLKKRHLITILQFLVGALVTFGGGAFALLAIDPFGTVLGLIHLSIGVAGVFGGILFVSKKDLPRQFLLTVNGVTIVYSALSVSIAGIESLLPSSAYHDSLIGTAVAILMSGLLIFLLTRK